MNKISTIISREYSTRVRKKSFLIMSIVGPLLFAGLMLAPALMMKMGDNEEKLIAVVDSSQMFTNVFPETEYMKFEYMPDANLKKYKDGFYDSPYYAILFINNNVVNNSGAVCLYSDKTPGIEVQNHISKTIEKTLEREKLRALQVDENILQAVKTNIDIRSVKITKDGEEDENNFTLNSIIGYLLGFLIYMTIFMSGSQVMRGVIEEKTNRIVEIIVSSVKPFQLMMGKIIGIGLVSLTQFTLWIVLTIALYSTIMPLVMPDVSTMGHEQEVQVKSLLESQAVSGEQQMSTISEPMDDGLKNIISSLPDIKFGTIIFSFLFFFFGGYFLYGAMFAAIASAVDSETDTQQFMLPITIPLILGILVMVHAINTPESQLTYWFSVIPFTSPIVMMARIPFGVPWADVILSGVLLIGTFIGITWLSGKIYRTGILMYGKKTNWKELWKWIRYKN